MLYREFTPYRLGRLLGRTRRYKYWTYRMLSSAFGTKHKTCADGGVRATALPGVVLGGGISAAGRV